MYGSWHAHACSCPRHSPAPSVAKSLHVVYIMVVFLSRLHIYCRLHVECSEFSEKAKLDYSDKPVQKPCKRLTRPF